MGSVALGISGSTAVVVEDGCNGAGGGGGDACCRRNSFTFVRSDVGVVMGMA